MAVTDQFDHDGFAMYRGDCLEVLPTLADGRDPPVHLLAAVRGLYHYSSSNGTYRTVTATSSSLSTTAM